MYLVNALIKELLFKHNATNITAILLLLIYCLILSEILHSVLLLSSTTDLKAAKHIQNIFDQCWNLGMVCFGNADTSKNFFAIGDEKILLFDAVKISKKLGHAAFKLNSNCFIMLDIKKCFNQRLQRLEEIKKSEKTDEVSHVHSDEDEKFKEEVLKTIEESKDWLTLDNMEEKIAEAVDNPINFNFGINLSGTITRRTALVLPPDHPVYQSGETKST